MTCDEVAEVIDALAAGEVTPSADMSAHLSSCAACGESLQTARAIDGLLRSRSVPAPPAQFTSRVVNRIHRATWRREQIVDGIFNAAMIAAAMIVVSGVGIALGRSGVSLLSRDAVQMFDAGLRAAAQKVAPSLPLYAGAAGLIAVALGLWWWASDSAAL